MSNSCSQMRMFLVRLSWLRSGSPTLQSSDGRYWSWGFGRSLLVSFSKLYFKAAAGGLLTSLLLLQVRHLQLRYLHTRRRRKGSSLCSLPTRCVNYHRDGGLRDPSRTDYSGRYQPGWRIGVSDWVDNQEKSSRGLPAQFLRPVVEKDETSESGSHT